MLLNDVDRSHEAKNCEDAFSARRGKFGKSGKSRYGSGNTDQNTNAFHNCNEKGHFARDCPKRNLKNESPGFTGKENKFNGSARCAENQGSEDMFVNDEALAVYTPHFIGKSN